MLVGTGTNVGGTGVGGTGSRVGGTRTGVLMGVSSVQMVNALKLHAYA